jgi:hypothetical protein
MYKLYVYKLYVYKLYVYKLYVYKFYVYKLYLCISLCTKPELHILSSFCRFGTARRFVLTHVHSTR